jgi:hypothetical protein
MDSVIDFFVRHLVYFYLLLLVLFILKSVIVTVNKGLSFTTIFISFFTIYTTEAIESSRRKWFMLMNNLLNFIFYVVAFMIIAFAVITMHAAIN